jgi:hypothetical protein
MNLSLIQKRAATAAFALGAAALLSSCFESDSTITVKKDGSGTIETKMVMSAQMAGMMKMAQGQEGVEVKNPLTDPEQLKKNAAKNGEGVEFVAVKELKFDDGREGSVATYKFADVRKLKMSPGEGPPNPGEEEAEEDNASPIRFDFQPGDSPKLTIIMPPPAAKEAAGDEAEPKAANEEDAMAMQMMGTMMQGMRLAMRVKVDGEITKTNAAHQDGSTVTLMDLDMGKIFSDPAVMKKLSSPDDMKDFAKFSKIAKDAGATVEPSPKVEIEFK